MLKSFINSSKKLHPGLFQCLNDIEVKDRFKIRLEYPLEFQDFSKNKGLGIVTGEKILSGSKIFSVSLTTAITGLELVDCDTKTKTRLEETAENVAKIYHETNQTQYHYTINMLKVIFQIVAQKSDPGLSLYHYSNYLYENYPKSVPLIGHPGMSQFIFSSHLKNLVEAQRTYFMSIAHDLEKNSLPFLKYTELLKTIAIVRSKALNLIPEDPKRFTKDTVMILCPVVDIINHSYKPNCKIMGTYNSFENDSLIEVRSTRDIEAGEELLLNYGNYNNYDLLMKYGFLEKNNPFDEFPLKLNFEKYLQFTSQLFDLKSKMFGLINEFSLEKINIYRDRIDPDMLSVLRIYFLTEEDVKNESEIHSYTQRDFRMKLNNKNEKLVFQLLIDNIQRQLSELNTTRDKLTQNGKFPDNFNTRVFYSLDELERSRNSINNGDICNALQIGLEEELILKKNLEFCTKQLKSCD